MTVTICFLQVFREYRQHFEAQKRKTEKMQRAVLDDAINDALHLYHENEALRRRLQEQKKEH